MLKEMSRIGDSSPRIFREHTSTSFSRQLFVCLILRAPSIFLKQGQSCSWWLVRKKGSFGVEIIFWWIWVSFEHDEVFVCMPSTRIWDEFPQSGPSRYYFKLNWKLIFAFVINSMGYSQDGDIIIHELKRKNFRGTVKIDRWQKPWRQNGLG